MFYGCAAIIMLLTYKEVDSGADKTSDIRKVLVDTITNLFQVRLLLVILLFSGFWLMMFQLWDLMPNFYTDWIDSSRFVESSSWLPRAWLDLSDARGPQLKQENVLNLNAVLIVLLIVPFSHVVARMKVLSAMTLGFAFTIGGIVISGSAKVVGFLFVGIALFSLGEMLTGPKKSEYFALIAPKGKKALYLGYVNIPIAIGQASGAWIAGHLYGTGGEKAVLSLRYLAEKTDYVKGQAWNGDVATLTDYVGVGRPEAFDTLQRVLGKNAAETTELLWTTYRPYQLWYVFAAIGVASLLGMLLFIRQSKKWKVVDG